MSEQKPADDTPTTDEQTHVEAAPQAPSEPASAGAMLRQARERAGLHIAALAVALKVPVRKIEALEADRHDQLPDAVFMRALASSICRHLKIDPAPVLERMPHSAVPRLAPEGKGLNAPFRSPQDQPRNGATQTLSRPALLAVGALLIGALSLMFLPERNEQPVEQAVEQAVVQPGAVAPALVAPIEPTPADAPQGGAAPLPMSDASGPSFTTTVSTTMGTLSNTASAAPATLPPATPIALAVPAAPPVPATAAPAAAVLATAPVAAAPAKPADTRPLVGFTGRGESWIKVTDATGAVTLQRILSVGETVSATGVLPLVVVVGRADLTEVTVRGRPFDTARWSKDNVARFEVK